MNGATNWQTRKLNAQHEAKKRSGGIRSSPVHIAVRYTDLPDRPAAFQNFEFEMTEIDRGIGVTPSEKYLASLADKAFLNLWSYPNLFIDRKQGGKGDGKELCDLLVVCGDHVLIFSDKSIGWPKAADFKVAWSRWYRHAIDKSVAQIGGAERWLAQHPDRIFLDSSCTQKLPITLPTPDRRRVHGIIVALGASEACVDHYKGDDGSFLITPDIKGAAHTDTDGAGFMPFGIGDVRPEGSFVHVFDDKALDLVLSELDTVIDFTEYLTRRERIIRSGRLMPANGEHELLGYYLLSEGPGGEHDFLKPGGAAWQDGEHLLIPAGTFAGLARQSGYQAKKKADEVSYAWDRLIQQFTDNILAGTSVAVFGEAPQAGEAEQALRSMALEPRVHRRLLGGSVVEAMAKAEKVATDRFVRVMLPGPHSPDRTVGYIFLVLAYPKFELKDGYEQYRKVRTNMLHAYCLHVLGENRSLMRAIGIGIDASSKVTGRQGGSEDLLALEVETWTPELEKQAADLRDKFDIMRPENVEKGHASTDEFPRVATEPRLNRQQRRAMERARRKAARRR